MSRGWAARRGSGYQLATLGPMQNSSGQGGPHSQAMVWEPSSVAVRKHLVPTMGSRTPPLKGGGPTPRKAQPGTHAHLCPHNTYHKCAYPWAGSLSPDQAGWGTLSMCRTGLALRAGIRVKAREMRSKSAGSHHVSI